ncbi:hypothetical protein B8A19_15615, partial [Staphylococcus aureus]
KKLNIDENDLNKIDQCVLQFGDIKIMIADDTEGLPITQSIILKLRLDIYFSTLQQNLIFSLCK